MAPLSTPSILSAVSPSAVLRFPSSADRGSSLTRGRRYNYGRWEGFKYSCFHYGAGLLLARPPRERGRGFFSLKITLSSIAHLPLFFSSLASRFLPGLPSSSSMHATQSSFLIVFLSRSIDSHCFFSKKLYFKYLKYSNEIESVLVTHSRNAGGQP